MKLCIVSATTSPIRAAVCFQSWGAVSKIVVVNGGGASFIPPQMYDTTWLPHDEYLGTVPAFKLGTDYALEHTDAEIIACLHDDLEILQRNWAERVVRHFQKLPACGLLGFGGAIGLGDDDLYQKPYEAKQLARKGFRSNLVDAEVHGIRSLLPERVSVLDGFSQVGRREFWEGLGYNRHQDHPQMDPQYRPWEVLHRLGLKHHIYDGALGCLAARYGWHTWFLPIRCRHFGGRTAVGDQGYQNWAKQQTELGDQGFWQQAHEICHREFKDVLPLRV